MPTKQKITPNVFEAIARDYAEASTARREEIYRQYHEEGWKQHEIATYWGIDVTRVNKIIKSQEEG